MNTFFPLAIWASNHRFSARILWLLIYALLAIVCNTIGAYAQDMGLLPNEYAIFGLLLPATLIATRYPYRHQYTSPAHFWTKRVSADVCLYALIGLAWVWIGCNAFASTGFDFAQPAFKAQNESRGMPIQLASWQEDRPAIQESLADIPGSQDIKQQKGWKKELRKAWKAMKAKGTPIRTWPRGLQFLFFIGMGFLAFILSILIAVLSCNLSCSGNGGGALVLGLLAFSLFLGSLTLAVFAFISLFRSQDANPSTPSKRKQEVDG